MLGGSSRIDITPPDPVQMAGYAARTKPSEGVHDPLFARALVLDDGATRIAVVSCDLAAVDRATARRVRARIEREAGILFSHTMLTCSHTHAGPLVATRRSLNSASAYLAELEDKMVRAAREAVGSLRPVHIGTGRAKVYLGVNRRERTPEGTIKLGKNPDGPASPYVHILLVVREGAGPMAALFSYGAHPVVLGSDNLQLSGDYAGRAEREVEENFGDRMTALFTLGFAGNVNVNVEEHTFAEVETAGVALGRAVLEELKNIELSAGHVLAARSMVVPLPLQSPPAPHEAERLLYEERERLTRLLGHGDPEAQIHTRKLMVDWASEVAALSHQGIEEHTAELEVQALAIGDTVLVGLSAEVFAEYAETFEEGSPFAHTFPVSVANGSIGYLPTAAAFEEGGYEVEVAPRYFGALGFRPEIEGIVRDAMATLLADVAGTPPTEQEEEPAAEEQTAAEAEP